MFKYIYFWFQEAQGLLYQKPAILSFQRWGQRTTIEFLSVLLLFCVFLIYNLCDGWRCVLCIIGKCLGFNTSGDGFKKLIGDKLWVLRQELIYTKICKIIFSNCEKVRRHTGWNIYTTLIGKSWKMKLKWITNTAAGLWSAQPFI